MYLPAQQGDGGAARRRPERVHARVAQVLQRLRPAHGRQAAGHRPGDGTGAPWTQHLGTTAAPNPHAPRTPGSLACVWPPPHAPRAVRAHGSAHPALRPVAAAPRRRRHQVRGPTRCLHGMPRSRRALRGTQQTRAARRRRVLEDGAPGCTRLSVTARQCRLLGSQHVEQVRATPAHASLQAAQAFRLRPWTEQPPCCTRCAVLCWTARAVQAQRAVRADGGHLLRGRAEAGPPHVGPAQRPRSHLGQGARGHARGPAQRQRIPPQHLTPGPSTKGPEIALHSARARKTRGRPCQKRALAPTSLHKRWAGAVAGGHPSSVQPDALPRAAVGWRHGAGRHHEPARGAVLERRACTWALAYASAHVPLRCETSDAPGSWAPVLPRCPHRCNSIYTAAPLDVSCAPWRRSALPNVPPPLVCPRLACCCFAAAECLCQRAGQRLRALVQGAAARAAAAPAAPPHAPAPPAPPRHAPAPAAAAPRRARARRPCDGVVAATTAQPLAAGLLLRTLMSSPCTFHCFVGPNDDGSRGERH